MSDIRMLVFSGSYMPCHNQPKVKTFGGGREQSRRLQLSSILMKICQVDEVVPMRRPSRRVSKRTRKWWYCTEEDTAKSITTHTDGSPQQFLSSTHSRTDELFLLTVEIAISQGSKRLEARTKFVAGCFAEGGVKEPTTTGSRRSYFMTKSLLWERSGRRRYSTGQLISSRRDRSQATVFRPYPLHKVTIKKSCRTGLRQGVRNNTASLITNEQTPFGGNQMPLRWRIGGLQGRNNIPLPMTKST
ncbi:uncharacterized protein ARMOST_20905 [Armillaria ostoyae]|uniref:Uncharacterized protein n=1 Tax=Armillaria ostoyae TaxID=47428 RepID=A0A284S8L2_ARMOS|nr:uncharacterized protein ARMOST_20905 [Armillaria ostoyae]